jgi:hypothetical protein
MKIKMDFKKCETCRNGMDILRIMMWNTKYVDCDVCPKCHAPELHRFSASGNDSKLKILKRGAYGIG